MKNLTFKGFMTRYIKNISANGTGSIFKLVREATATNPRIMEPTLLYAAICGNFRILDSALRKFGADSKYIEIFDKHLRNINEENAKSIISKLPEEYQEIYEEYLKARGYKSADDPVKERYKKKILKIAKKKGLTISMIAKKTGLQRGNAYRFFSKNMNEFLSTDLLQAALDVLEKEYGHQEKTRFKKEAG